MRKKLNLLWTIIKILSGISLLVISLRGLNWTELSYHFHNLSILWLIVAIVSILVSLFLKILRWKYLLYKFEIKPSFFNITGAFYLCQAVNILLPIRGGEFARIGIILADKPNSHIALTVFTIVLEKVIDTIALIIAGTLLIFYLPLEIYDWIKPIFTITGVVSILGIIIFIIFSPGIKKYCDKFVKKFSHPLVIKMLQAASKTIESSLWLRNIRRITPLLLITVVIWVSMWSTNLFLFKSFNLPIDAVAGGMVLVLGYLKALPFGIPGNFGTAYFFTELALKPFGIPYQMTIAYAIILHAIVTFPPLLFSGIYLLISGNFNFLNHNNIDKKMSKFSSKAPEMNTTQE